MYPDLSEISFVDPAKATSPRLPDHHKLIRVYLLVTVINVIWPTDFRVSRLEEIPTKFLMTSASGHWEILAAKFRMSASLIGRLRSSAFRLSTTAVSMSLAGSRFSSESARRPFHHGVRRRGGTIFTAALPLD